MTFNEMIVLMELDWRKTAKTAAITAGLGIPAVFASRYSSPPIQNPSSSYVSQEPNTDIDSIERDAQPLTTTTPSYIPKKHNKLQPSTFSTPNSSQVNPSNIDIRKIIKIESRGNPNAESPVGAKGIMQIMPNTWDELVRKMGKSYTRADMNDPKKNEEVGTYYFNVEIPKLLKSAGLPVNTKTILAAYNWGVGNLKHSYKKHGEDWVKFAPKETKNYIIKYFMTG